MTIENSVESSRKETSNSGKIVVGMMLLSAVAMFIFSVWFINSSSPVDQRFNMKRDKLDENAPGPQILLQEAGNYARKSFEPLAIGTDNVLHGSAVFEDGDGKTLTFEVQSTANSKAALKLLQNRYQPTDDDSILNQHFDAQVPYAYKIYQYDGVVYLEFGWVNNNWVFRAKAIQSETDAERLLRFVDSYPF